MSVTSRVTQEGSDPRIPDKPLETYHPETIHLTAPRTKRSRGSKPSTWAMMALGFAGLGFLGYRKTRSDNAWA